jgi:hypothetical protein
LKNILFLSTHNLATNPRLVKEIELALMHGFKVTVLCCGFNNWSFDNNERLKKVLLPKINYQEIAATRKPFAAWFLSSVLFQLSAFLLKFLPGNVFWLSVRSNKRSWLLMIALQKMKYKADLVIAHNPGSFYPAMRYAQKRNIAYGIDLEDYHPGETNDPDMQRVLKQLQQRTLPAAWYVSAASPLIAEYVNADLSNPLPEVLELLNYFDKEEFVQPVPNQSSQLQLVWFSQNIAGGRGLEEILPVVKKNQHVLLHLYGHLQEDFYRSHLVGIPNILIHAAMPQGMLHKELSKYDVGLALEKPGSNLNRDICVTNKILAYQQAGLYILASYTKAQESFIQKNLNVGVLTAMGEANLERATQQIIQNKNTIRSERLLRYQQARNKNWASESAKLLEQWKKL